jgi:hypothetical protein
MQSKLLKVKTHNFNGVQYKIYSSGVSLHEGSSNILTLKRLQLNV